MSYYKEIASAQKDVQKVLMVNMGKEIDFNSLLLETRRCYGFGEKKLMEFLQPYIDAVQITIYTEDSGKKVIVVGENWIMNKEAEAEFNAVFGK